MLSQVAKRLLSIIPLLFLVSIILFFLISFLPGNVVEMLLSAEGGSITTVRSLEESLGFNKPIYEQYFMWLTNVFKGNMGTSYLAKMPVVDAIILRLPVSFELMILAMVFGIIVGLPLSVVCAVKRNTIIDYIISTVSVLGVATPSFFLGILLVYFFSIIIHILPASGYVPFFEDPIRNLTVMVLPVLSIGIAFMASLVRQTRSALLEVLNQDYILTAKAKGLQGWVVLWKHALRNAMIPVITVISMQIGRMIGGAVIAETVFLLPGMGKLLVDGINTRDYPLVMAQILFLALVIILVNTAVDIIYLFIDPRISHSGEAK